jgi:hypothetical protein
MMRTSSSVLSAAMLQASLLEQVLIQQTYINLHTLGHAAVRLGLEFEHKIEVVFATRRLNVPHHVIVSLTAAVAGITGVDALAGLCFQPPGLAMRQT